MALKWAWGFSTDQTIPKLEAIGWSLAHYLWTISQTETHTYPSDAVTKRAALSSGSQNTVPWRTTSGTAAFDGWVAVSFKATGSTQYEYYRKPIGVWQTGLTGIYAYLTLRSSAPPLQLYVDNVYKATSVATLSYDTWHRLALKYEGSTTTFKGTLYLDGVEIIAEQTDTATTAWTDATLMYVEGQNFAYYGSTYFADVITYDSTSDAGEVEVWCSTYEPQTDDAETGTWVQSTGSDNFAVVTPWDDATYTEETSPTTGDKFTCGFTDSIATRLGISPTIHAVVSQAAVSGGADFKALLDVGAGDVVGTTVTSDVNDPTYGYATETSGITASSTIKIGIKIP